MAEQQHAPNAPPERFVKQVKQGLENLYDFPYLQRHPLAQELGFSAEQPDKSAGQYLRRELMQAIEALSPGPDVSFRAPHARLYNLLHLRYVEGMTVQEAANELGISVRQAYRDLRRGEDNVAEVLWGRHGASEREGPRASHLSSFEEEMSRLEPHPQSTDLRLLLKHAQKAVEPLASLRKIAFQTQLPAEPVIVSVDAVLARQVLISLLSRASQQAGAGALHLRLTGTQDKMALELHYQAEERPGERPAANSTIAQIALRLGWTIKEQDYPDGSRSITLNIKTHGPVILVIDDNESLVELLDRYLTDHHCRVISAVTGQEGLDLAQDLTPDAIILDVMIPEVDGWEILQTLRVRPETARIPIIICSVINDPELAYTLGASLVLSKPVSRDNVLNALRQLGIV